MTTKYFTWRSANGVDENRCIICPNDYDNFPFNIKEGGSFAVAPARVLGLTYAEYLRFVRDMFPNAVTLSGKNHLYVIAYWKKGKELYTFVDLLNKKLTLAVKNTKNN